MKRGGVNGRCLNNIYDFLEAVRQRPSMYVTDGNRLSDLELMVWGYQAALSAHGIVEPNPKFDQNEFGNWLYKKTGIGAALGWSHILDEKYSNPNIDFTKFFEYLDEYKLLMVGPDQT